MQPQQIMSKYLMDKFTERHGFEPVGEGVAVQIIGFVPGVEENPYISYRYSPDDGEVIQSCKSFRDVLTHAREHYIEQGRHFLEIHPNAREVPNYEDENELLLFILGSVDDAE